MDKVNIGDQVLNETLKMMDNVSVHLVSEYKGVKPFDKQKVDNRELLYWYNQLTPDDMMYLSQKYPDKINNFIYTMEMAKKKTL